MLPWTRKFPYTNFHELNTDWILQQLQECADAVRASATEAKTAADQVSDLAARYDEALHSLDQQLLSMQRDIQCNRDAALQAQVDASNAMDAATGADIILTGSSIGSASTTVRIRPGLTWDDVITTPSPIRAVFITERPSTDTLFPSRHWTWACSGDVYQTTIQHPEDPVDYTTPTVILCFRLLDDSGSGLVYLQNGNYAGYRRI